MSGNDGKDVDEGMHLGNKRHRPEDEVNEEDDEPSTRRHENGSSSLTRISGRTTLSRALRPLPAGRLSDRVNVRWQSDTHAPVILSGLQQLYNDRNLCDVTIRVDGEDFQAHRVVLAASSDFLRALLAGQWRESKEEVVRLDGIDRNSFRLLLEYIYSGEILVGGLEELFNLLVSGEHVGLHGLCELCIQRLQQRLDLSNSLQIRLFAAEIGCKELEEAAFDIVLGDFAQVAASSPDFLNLDTNQLADIMSNDRLAVDSEEEVLQALLKWVQHDPAGRKPGLPGLLARVRMGLMPLAVLERLPLEPIVDAVIRDFPACAAQVQEGKRMQELLLLQEPGATAWWAGTELGLLNPSLAAAPEQVRMRSKRMKHSFLALGGRPAWKRVEKFDVKTKTWTEVAPMLQSRMRHGSSSLKGLIYVIGGKDEAGHALKSVERYDPRQDKWEELPPMILARTGLGVGNRLRSTESYDLHTQQWTERAPMNEARCAVRIAALNQCIYAVGGRSETDAALSSVEVLNPTTNTWRFVKSMHTARVGAGAEVLDGRLYAVGGKDEQGNKLKTVERYDPQKDEWEMVANMGTKRWGAGVAVMENRLWVIGGMNGAERGALPTLEVYDPQVNKWEEINPGPKLARGSCTFAAI